MLTPAMAQEIIDNRREQWVQLNADTIQIDSLSIVPNTLQLWSPLPDSCYTLDFPRAELYWLCSDSSRKQQQDSILLSYRVFPYAFAASYARKTFDKVQQHADYPGVGYTYDLGEKDPIEELFKEDGIDYSGSFGRGISVGNNQDLIVNSDFNLRMSGKLRDDIEILAAISDNNIPFQPEGNTQQLQEFDRIFIQLKKDRSSLLLGDFDLLRPDSYFMNVRRSSQGAKVLTGGDLGAGRNWTSGVSAAVSKGNYNRQIIVGEEGNQGPYKLQGANNESFVIILSGSERVFIDGRRMERGADYDYVIDYNTAEVTFTARQLITKDKRISIEFEYADRNYLRSLLYGEADYRSEKLHVYTRIFTEQDAKNQPLIDGSLSDELIDTLRNIGDELDRAVVSGVNETGYIADRVQYYEKDTIVDGELYTPVYSYTADSTLATYTLSFSFMGAGNGDYILSDNTINGRVYEWVPPDSLGNAKGSYAPLSQLITPVQRRLMSVGGEYQIGKGTKVKAEFAYSDKDVNTFSDFDDQDDKGTAFFSALDHRLRLGKEKKATVLLIGRYEFRGARFEPLERYRSVEFTRDWNTVSLGLDAVEQDQHLVQAGWRYQYSKFADVDYQWSSLMMGDRYTGYLQQLNSRLRGKRFDGFIRASYLNAKANALQETRFFRPNFDFAYLGGSAKTWRIGIRGEQEDKRETIIGADNSALVAGSHHYDQLSFYVQSADTAANHLQFLLERRWDAQLDTIGQGFIPKDAATKVALKGRLSKRKSSQLTFDLSYRSLNVAGAQDSIVHTLLGDVTHDLRLKKGFLRSFTRYQLGSGQEPVTDYFYQPAVGTTRGSYLWLDRNEDGLQDKGEFEFDPLNAAFADTTYNRILLPTNDYVKTYSVRYDHTISITPKVLLVNAEHGWGKLAARFSSQTQLTINKSIFAQDFNGADWIPYVPSEAARLAAQTLQHRTTLFFNRNNPRFDANAYVLQLRDRRLLVGGSDSRTKDEQGGGVKYAPNASFTFRVKGAVGQQSNDSEAFPNRGFAVDFKQLEPSVSFLYQRKWKLTASYEWKDQLNNRFFSEDSLLVDSLGLERSTNQKLSLEGRFGSAIKRSVQAKLSFVLVDYNRPTNTSPAAYTLLEGLQAGRNYLWSLNYNTRLSKSVELTLGYDGRKTGDNRPNHVGRASVRAVF